MSNEQLIQTSTMLEVKVKALHIEVVRGKLHTDL